MLGKQERITKSESITWHAELAMLMSRASQQKGVDFLWATTCEWAPCRIIWFQSGRGDSVSESA